MRIAALSDIHGNFPALEAVLRDLVTRGVDHVIVAGDLVGGLPHPREVIETLAALPLPSTLIRGNNDSYLLRLHEGSAPAHWWTALQWGYTRWTYDQLAPEHLRFLQRLPEQTCVRFPRHDPLRVVHGSPRGVADVLLPYQDAAKLDAVLSEIDEPVMVCGHTHQPWIIWRGERIGINPGSVGAPTDGDWRASYVLLDWSGDGWQPQICRVAYDRGRVSAAAKARGLLAAGGPAARAWLSTLQHGADFLVPLLRHLHQAAAEQGLDQIDFVPDDILQRAAETWHWDVKRIALGY